MIMLCVNITKQQNTKGAWVYGPPENFKIERLWNTILCILLGKFILLKLKSQNTKNMEG